MPAESCDRFTRISDKALYNFPEHYFVNHLLCLEDMDGLSEEAEYSVRELISSGERKAAPLRSAVSVKDESGQICEGQKTVRGPVASLCCTTKGEIYEDNMGRVFLLTVDESAAQTERGAAQRIIAYQNRKAAGGIAAGKEHRVQHFLQQLVRMLLPLEVVNPFAEQLSLPKEAHKIRRLNALFQGFVKVIAVVHQKQRKKDSKGRIVATTADVAAAIHILFDSIVLKVDELDGSLRQFFEQLKSYVQAQGKEESFTRFEVRKATGCGKTQQHHYMQKLVELEYLQQYGGAAFRFANRGYHWVASPVQNSAVGQLQCLAQPPEKAVATAAPGVARANARQLYQPGKAQSRTPANTRPNTRSRYKHCLGAAKQQKRAGVRYSQKLCYPLLQLSASAS